MISPRVLVFLVLLLLTAGCAAPEAPSYIDRQLAARQSSVMIVPPHTPTPALVDIVNIQSLTVMQPSPTPRLASPPVRVVSTVVVPTPQPASALADKLRSTKWTQVSLCDGTPYFFPPAMEFRPNGVLGHTDPPVTITYEFTSEGLEFTLGGSMLRTYTASVYSSTITLITKDDRGNLSGRQRPSHFSCTYQPAK
jgi:hypothetical protein